MSPGRATETSTIRALLQSSSWLPAAWDAAGDQEEEGRLCVRVCGQREGEDWLRTYQGVLLLLPEITGDDAGP